MGNRQVVKALDFDSSIGSSNLSSPASQRSADNLNAFILLDVLDREHTEPLSVVIVLFGVER